MAKSDKRDRYAEAGVDIDAGKRLVQLIKPLLKKTYKSNVLSDLGGYTGLYSVNLGNIKRPVLVSSTDGVGTKLKIAFMLNKHDTVGIDLVAMCVNDILVQGAAPLFMLDYLAMGKLDHDTAVEIIKGISKGCKDAGCTLIGGETAEMPDFYKPGEYDLAGFAVGLADGDSIIDGSEIGIKHELIGIGSSGLHSNGYSLVRKIFFEGLKMSVDNYVEEFGRTLGEELIEPTKIYAKLIGNLIKNYNIFGISHITGGGIVENLPRILPKDCQAVISRSSWTPHPVFQLIQKAGNLTEEEIMRTFNNGLGLIIAVSEKDSQDVMDQVRAMGEKAFQIGYIEEKKNGKSGVVFID